MKRVFSLLLLIPFLTVQAWALRGGPYDSMISRSAYAGTYGVAFTGESNVFGTTADVISAKVDGKTVPVPRTSTAPVLDDADNFLRNTNGQACVGIMTLSVPNAGPTSGRVLLFNAGMMYLGNAQGILNAGNNKEPGKAKMTLLQQMSHYTVHTTSDGIQKQGQAVVDLMLSGPLHLDLNVNYQTGLIEVTGKGQLYKYAPLLTAVKVDTDTNTLTESEGTEESVTRGSATTTTSTALNTSGAVETITQNETITGPSANQTTNGTKTKVIGSVNYSPDSVRQAPVTAREVFMNLDAVGVREDTTGDVLSPFLPLTDPTFFQIDIPEPSVPTTSGILKIDPGTRPVV